MNEHNRRDRPMNEQRKPYKTTPNRANAFHRPDNEPPQPTFTGTGLLSKATLKAIKQAGGAFELAVWVNRAESGTRYLSLRIQPPYQPEGDNGNGGEPAEKSPEQDNDPLPF